MSRSLGNKFMRGGQRGLTLVELMVALVIGLVIALAASALYLATSETSRSVRALGDINETGKIALDMIGREIQKAGFFPAQYPSTTSTQIVGTFYNGKSGSKPAFDNGLFGCDGAKYDPSTHACGATTAGDPDTIIVNYFATPEFGASSSMGNSNDCNRQPVSGDADNTARAAANAPLFVSNRFGVVATASYIGADGITTINAKSLACHGNGADSAATAQPMLQGVEDLAIRYGLYSSTAQSPDKYLTAQGVAAEPTVGDKTNWQRVTAVKVCVLIRSLENSRQEDKSSAKRTYRNCRGADITPAAGDRFIYKSFERVYAVRNNLNDIL